jgi:hypothetical protein
MRGEEPKHGNNLQIMVSGHFNPDELSNAINLIPSRVYLEGEVIPYNPSIRPISTWILKSSDHNINDVGETIEDLLSKIMPSVDNWIIFQQKNDIQISIVGDFYDKDSHCCICINKKLLTLLNVLSIDLDFSIKQYEQ